MAISNAAPVGEERVSAERCDDRRSEFLLETYRQTSTHLGRYVTGVWQCVGVVGAALIVFAQEKDKPLNDYSCALVILLCGWLAATTLDASNWFNRNLAIITNIERLFLSNGDLSAVHFFFGKHRVPGSHAQHFSIQLWLSGAVAILVAAYHFSERVWPGLSLPLTQFDPRRALPYVLFLLVLVALVLLQRDYKKKDEKFRQSSPGVSVQSEAPML